MLPISWSDFEDFRDVQIKPRHLWPATFSCNGRGKVWPYTGPGYSNPSQMNYMGGLFPLLDEIVRLALEIDSDGKRFTVNDRGVFLADAAYYYRQICQFKFLG